MGNTLQLFEVAKLHQRDVERELAFRLMVRGTKSANSKPSRLMKRMNNLSVTFLKMVFSLKKQESPSTEKQLTLNTQP